MPSNPLRSLLALVLAAAFALPVSAYVYLNSDSTWLPGNIPMQIMVGAPRVLSDGSNYQQVAQTAMSAWNSYLGTVQFLPQVAAAGQGELGNSINEIYFDGSVEGSAFGSGVLAVTLIYPYPTINEYYEADIVFNTAYAWDSYRGNLQAPEDFQRVLLHELGHVLGLDHPDQHGQSVTALMNAYVSNLDQLAADDINGAQSLYRAPGQTEPPANDNFANATNISLSSGTVQVSGDSYYATKEAGEPDHDPGDGVGGASVWWKWTAPYDGTVMVTTQYSHFDTLLGVYTGSLVSALTTIATNDDASSDPHLQYSRVSFTAAAGTTYAFAVDGWRDTVDGAAAASGLVKLNLNFSPKTYFLAAAAGISHSLFITANHALWAVGANLSGQLGTGDNDDRNQPTQIAAGVISAAAKYGSFFIKSDHTLWAMGPNSFGQLGDGTTTDRNAPVYIADHVTTVFPGDSHTLFLKDDHTLWGMGSNEWGELGSNTLVNHPSPVLVASNVMTASAGGSFSAFVTADGTLWTLGFNGFGQLGDNTVQPHYGATSLTTDVAMVAAGSEHLLYVTTSGELYACGRNNNGQLGDGTTIDRPIPVRVATGVDALSASSNFSLYKTGSGALYGMGNDNYGQLADSSFGIIATPKSLASGGNPIAGGSHTFFTANDGALWGVGNNYYGQLGVATAAARQSSSVEIVNLIPPTVSAVSGSIAAYPGDTASLDATASGLPAPTLQWQRLQSGESDWVDLLDSAPYTGTTSTSLTISPVTAGMNGDQFRLMATNAYAVGYSPVLSLDVRKFEQSITFATLPDIAYTSEPLTLSATASSALPVRFTLASGAAAISGSQLTLTGTGIVVVEASQPGDDTYAAAAPVQRSFTVSGNVAAWSLGHFDASERADSAISGPEADPDHDGISNLLEYALGLDPRGANTSGLPEVATTATDWTYTFTRPSDRPDLTYAVEASTDLVNWTTVSTAPVSTGGGTETWRASVPQAQMPTAYFRLKITTN